MTVEQAYDAYMDIPSASVLFGARRPRVHIAGSWFTLRIKNVDWFEVREQPEDISSACRYVNWTVCGPKATGQAGNTPRRPRAEITQEFRSVREFVLAVLRVSAGLIQEAVVPHAH